MAELWPADELLLEAHGAKPVRVLLSKRKPHVHSDRVGKSWYRVGSLECSQCQKERTSSASDTAPMRACQLSYGVLFAFLGEALALRGVEWTGGTRGAEFPGTASPLPKLSVKNGRFVTATDDEVLLRGTSLDHNFHAPSIKDEQVDEYRQLGWNLVRSLLC